MDPTAPEENVPWYQVIPLGDLTKDHVEGEVVAVQTFHCQGMDLNDQEGEGEVILAFP